MYEIAVILTTLLMLASSVYYVRCAWLRLTNPVPATWILMMVVMSLSLWMYWHSPRKSWTANIGVVTATVNVAIVLLGVIATNIRHRTLFVSFDRLQKRCLVGGGGIVVFWLITNQPLVSYVLVQIIALIGYFATVKRLFKAKHSTEPLFTWITVFLATLCALYPAWVKNDLFSWIYLSRAIPSTALIIYLIARIKKRMRQTITNIQDPSR